MLHKTEFTYTCPNISNFYIIQMVMLMKDQYELTNQNSVTNGRFPVNLG